MAKKIDVMKSFKGDLCTEVLTFSGIRLDAEAGRIEAVHKLRKNNGQYVKSPEPPKHADIENILEDNFLGNKITGSELIQAIQELGENLYDNKYD